MPPQLFYPVPRGIFHVLLGHRFYYTPSYITSLSTRSFLKTKKDMAAFAKVRKLRAGTYIKIERTVHKASLETWYRVDALASETNRLGGG